MRIGIPRGLFYFYYYPFWKIFFEDLGLEVVVSSPTNRSIIDRGVAIAVDETCFPVKVFFGHVAELCEQKLDYLLVPRYVSVEHKSYICPKFMGVPDMVRASFPSLPVFLSPLVDLSRNDKVWQKEILKLGRKFTLRSSRINKAYEHGMEELKRFRKIASEGYSLEEAIEIWEGGELKLPEKWDLEVGVLGHGYALYDTAVSLRLIKRLREMGCRVHMVETLDKHCIESQAATLPKRVFWTLGRRIVGTALHLRGQKEIDGIIYLACFGCGPDSLVGDLVERKMNEKPFMMLTIDEHSGEAGVITRLEAFCDMLRRRRMQEHESKLPAHGEFAYSSELIAERP